MIIPVYATKVSERSEEVATLKNELQPWFSKFTSFWSC